MDEGLIEKVWEKATQIEGFNPGTVRKDCCGALILRTEYGNRNSKFGWEMDHVFPLSKGGGNDLLNLRPMQWENNAAKGDDFPVYNSAVSAEGNDNVHEASQYRINTSLMEKLKEIYHIEDI